MARAPKPGDPFRMMIGPFSSVRTTIEPVDDTPEQLNDAYNIFIPDPAGKSGVYARPGFAKKFTAAYSGRGQGGYSHAAMDGTRTSFIFANGRMYRVDPALTFLTDVTPVGVTIDNSIGTRVSCVSLIGNLVVNDSVNPPWFTTDATTTPIVATYIDYDGAGGPWSARPGTLYKGAIFYPLILVNGVDRQTDVSWCNPGTPAVGWQQANFDNNWTLITNSNGIIYAIRGTNTSIYYWRELSIGIATGDVGPQLASSATEDSIGFNVGAQTAYGIQEFGNTFFFPDAFGRPCMFKNATPPPILIWHQMRAIVDAQSIASPSITASNITSALEPTLNLYIVSIWSSGTSTQQPPTEAYAFDASTGNYVGRWTVGDTDGSSGAPIESMFVLQDSSGRTTLVFQTQGGDIWSMNSLSSTADVVTLEGVNPPVLVTEDGFTVLETESLPANWLDNDLTPYIRITSGRMGYSPDALLHLNMGTFITLSPDPCQVSITTTFGDNQIQGTPAPLPSRDSTYRLVAGLDTLGRGALVTVGPPDVTGQWSFQQMTLLGDYRDATFMDP